MKTQKQIESIDITGQIGPLDHFASGWLANCPVPMYSFTTPTYAFWNGFAKGLARRGLTEKQIFAELQSVGVRHMLDKSSHEIETAGEGMAMDYKSCVTRKLLC